MVYEQWRTQILGPLLASEPSLPDELLDTEVIVFSADTDRTHMYVFESDKLPEIRGASRLLAALNRGDEWTTAEDGFQQWRTSTVQQIFEAYQIPAEGILFAEGGSVLALLPVAYVDDQPLAAYVATDLKQAYLQATLGAATITTVWKPFTARTLLYGITTEPQITTSNAAYKARLARYQDVPSGRAHFGETILLMANNLRKAKQHRRQALIERMPFAQVCHSCQTRPAEAVAYAEDRNPWPLCAPCAEKRRWGGVRERSYWFDRLTAHGLEAEPAEYPEDLEQIANGREVALVYADGDGIGSHLHSLQTPAAYRGFSQALNAVTEAAVIDALNSSDLSPYPYEKPDGSIRKIYPWEVITIGGDDVMLIVPAAHAMNLALALAQSFRERAKENEALGSRGLTMSVGLAVGKSKTPVRLLREAAYAALKNAKRLTRETGESSIDYHNFVTEGLPGQNLAQWRYQTKRVGDSMLTARPYSFSSFERLLACLNLLADVEFPRSQLHILADSMTRSFNQGHILYYYQRARLSNQLRRQLYRLEQAWQADREIWPWKPAPDLYQDDYNYDSVLVDLANAYDFYKPERGR